MELVKITELTGMLGITSRSLRYYEQAGLCLLYTSLLKLTYFITW